MNTYEAAKTLLEKVGEGPFYVPLPGGKTLRVTVEVLSRRIWGPIELRRLKSLLALGFSDDRIAETLMCSMSSLRRAMRDHGIKRSAWAFAHTHSGSARRRKLPGRQEVVRLYEEGMKVPEIAKATGYSRSRVQGLLSEAKWRRA